jgi:hypothetical protein
VRVVLIPLFAGKPSHSFVPLGRRPAGARSEGQGRPTAGAPRAPFTVASTLAGWRRSGVGAVAALAISLLSFSGAVVPAVAQDVAAERALAAHPYAVHVAEAARRFGIPEGWIWAVMRVESNGDPRAVSSASAMGLMQIMPGTWADLRARYGLGADPFDVRDNIMAGAAYLRLMHDRYGNATAMLAAYNAGPGRYDEHLSRGRPLPAETRAYLARLASISGDPGEVQLAVAPLPDPLAWRRATLFVRIASAAETMPTLQTSGGTAAPDPTADAPSEVSQAGRAAAVPSSASTPADTLFVPRAGAGRPQ